jgi:hypothetical protein
MEPRCCDLTNLSDVENLCAMHVHDHCCQQYTQCTAAVDVFDGLTVLEVLEQQSSTCLLSVADTCMP